MELSDSWQMDLTELIKFKYITHLISHAKFLVNRRRDSSVTEGRNSHVPIGKRSNL
jgi:hypothetical protein